MLSDLKYYSDRIESIEQQLTAVMKATSFDEGWNNIQQIEINKLIKEIQEKYPLEDRISKFELCNFNGK